MYIYVCLEKSRNDGQVTLFEKCETQKEKFFRQHKLKTSDPLGLNQKEEYLF